MRIGVIGTRGFPEIQGGIETHCMELYQRIGSLGDNKIVVYRRKPYLNSENRKARFQNIRFIDFYVPKSKNFETFLHSLYATVHALFQRFDIVHFHNTGPGFFIPLLRLSGAKIVFTYHNISYIQKKWNSLAKSFLILSEKISISNSDFVIFISEIIKTEMIRKYTINNFKIILNGVNLAQKSANSDYIESIGIEKQKYIISVGRFMEEKGFDYLIRAFRKTNITDYKLVLVGDTDYPTDYSNKLKSLAKENDVVLTGFIKGDKLNQIYSFARLFIISSFVEGLPIALLEAMSYNIDILASDIPANLQVGLEKDDYFTAGDEDELINKIIKKTSVRTEHSYLEILTEKFNWDNIAKETYNIYKNLII